MLTRSFAIAAIIVAMGVMIAVLWFSNPALQSDSSELSSVTSDDDISHNLASHLDLAAQRIEHSENSMENRQDNHWPYLCGRYLDPLSGEAVRSARQDEADRGAEELFDSVRGLSTSSDPEHLLVTGLLGGVGPTRVDFSALERAFQTEPGNVFVNWHLLSACSKKNSAEVCRNNDIEQRLLEIDGENAAVWAKIAINRYKNGDTQGAIDALRFANTSAEFNGYFVEHVFLFERGLAAATNMDYSERVIAAIGAAAAMVSSTAQLIGVCQATSESSSEWREACLRFGQRLELDGQTLIDNAMGVSLQKKMYEFDGAWQDMADADERKKVLSQNFQGRYKSDFDTVFQFDERVMSKYLAEWEAHGEVAAVKYADAEVARLQKISDYNPCELVPTPVP